MNKETASLSIAKFQSVNENINAEASCMYPHALCGFRTHDSNARKAQGQYTC